MAGNNKKDGEDGEQKRMERTMEKTVGNNTPEMLRDKTTLRNRLTVDIDQYLPARLMKMVNLR